jgi:hypothetical protein
VKTLFWTLATLMKLSGLAPAQSTRTKDAAFNAVKEKLIGAWRLAWMAEPGQTENSVTLPTGRHADLHARVRVF